MPREYYDDDYEPEYRRRGRSSGDYDDYSEGRSRGGQRSSHSQERDEYGRFAGYEGERGSSRNGGGRSRGGYEEERGGYGRGGEIVDPAGRHYTRESWERAEEGRRRGGEHSHGGYGYSPQEEDYDDYEGGRGSGSSRGRSSYSGGYGDITDSAGRHYSRESWERAQEGRSRGGHH